MLSAPSRPGAEFSDRWTLAVRTSQDGGRTWSKDGAVVLRERAGYSDMAVLPGGRIGMLYETANGTPHGYIKFTAFGPHELQAAAEDLTPRRTADTSAQHDDAVVHGAPRLGNRPDGGKAMRFDGKDDFLRLIDCPDSLRLGDGDFAVATWVKYKTRGQDRESGLRQPLVWAYGQGPAAKQFRIEADPETGRLEATANAGTGPVSVTAGTRTDDDAWHHVVFQRKGARLELSVDGGPAATAPSPPASPTSSPPGRSPSTSARSPTTRPSMRARWTTYGSTGAACPATTRPGCATAVTSPTRSGCGSPSTGSGDHTAVAAAGPGLRASSSRHRGLPSSRYPNRSSGTVSTAKPAAARSARTGPSGNVR